MCVLQDWSWTFSWRWRRRQATVLVLVLDRGCGKFGSDDVEEMDDEDDGSVDVPRMVDMYDISSGVNSSSVELSIEKSGLGSESLHIERWGASSGINVCCENLSTISVIGPFGPSEGK